MDLETRIAAASTRSGSSITAPCTPTIAWQYDPIRFTIWDLADGNPLSDDRKEQPYEYSPVSDDDEDVDSTFSIRVMMCPVSGSKYRTVRVVAAAGRVRLLGARAVEDLRVERHLHAPRARVPLVEAERGVGAPPRPRGVPQQHVLAPGREQQRDGERLGRVALGDDERAL